MRNLTSINDISTEELNYILDLTEKLKNDKAPASDRLRGKSIGLVFQKPSNRTRVSFDVGISQLGGHCLYLSPEEINLGVRESVADVSKTLSRYLDAIVARVFSHKDITLLTKNADIPIINGLSDLHHPCQGLTDIFSIKEKFGTLEGINVAYIGDGNNVCHSLMLACAKTGANIAIATPKGYEADVNVVKKAKSIAKESSSKIKITTDPIKAAKNAHAIYTDVWTSMGQEEEEAKRIKDFEGFQINSSITKVANKDFIFMHCLPAHRGVEVTSDVIDGKHSIVFDQAENRLHTQKAILIFLFEKN